MTNMSFVSAEQKLLDLDGLTVVYLSRAVTDTVNQKT